MLSDDNFYRLSSNPQRESRVRVAAGLSTGLELGQQQLTIAGRVHDNRFENASELDYVGGGAELRLDWRVGSRLDGVLAHNYVRELTSFDRVRPGRVLRRDITTIAESRASVGYFLLPRLQVRAEAASVDWAHSAPTWRASELEERQYA